MLKFCIDGQKIDLINRQVVADQQLNFVDMCFLFSADWDDLDKTAQFVQEDKTYHVHLGSDTVCHCMLPAEIKTGCVSISIFGYAVDGSVRGTTVPICLSIKRAGFKGDGEAPIPPTPDLYAQLLEEIDKKIASLHDGKDGADGVDGKDGADGKSAYQIAVEAGYTGTETEWLASLKGEKGDTGEAGASGEKGEKGDRGEKGDTGAAGKDGTNGKDGADGFSPSAKVEKTGSVVTITITDKDGTTTESFTEGADVDLTPYATKAFSSVRLGNSGEYMFTASNKSDTITFGVDGGITIEIDKDRKSVIIGCHTHANMTTLDRITESDWLKLVTQTHTHTNIEVLHALTPANLADIQTNFPKKIYDLQTTLGDIQTALDSFDPSAWVVGGSMELSGAMTGNLPSRRSFVGSYKNTENSAWYNVVSVRHRNGYNDGDQHGMVIYSDMGGFTSDLQWNRQGGSGAWQGARTLLDTKNYSNLMSKELTTENLNDSAVNGICGFFYAADGNTCTNTAVSGKPFFMFAIRISTAAKTQVAFYPHNNAIYMRSWSGNDWTKWRQI